MRLQAKISSPAPPDVVMDDHLILLSHFIGWHLRVVLFLGRGWDSDAKRNDAHFQPNLSQFPVTACKFSCPQLCTLAALECECDGGD
jgi:hypothetical protein